MRRSKTDWWACRDSVGLIHAAKVERFFDDDDNWVTRVQLATGCCPNMQGFSFPRGTCRGHKLPEMSLAGPGLGKLDGILLLVAYNVREAPTCVKCAVASSAFVDPSLVLT